MLVPTIRSTGTLSSSSTLITPTCAAPRAPPPDRTSPIFGRPSADGGTAAGVVVGEGETGCAIAPNEATSEAQANRRAARPGIDSNIFVLDIGSFARLGH